MIKSPYVCGLDLNSISLTEGVRERDSWQIPLGVAVLVVGWTERGRGGSSYLREALEGSAGQGSPGQPEAHSAPPRTQWFLGN